ERRGARLRGGPRAGGRVEIAAADAAPTSPRTFSGQGMEEIGVTLSALFRSMPGMARTRRRSVTVPEALDLLGQEEAGRLVDQDRVNREALLRAESAGIIFIDEIDNIASREGAARGGGPDVSRERAQRDILPIVAGGTVTTKYA